MWFILCLYTAKINARPYHSSSLIRRTLSIISRHLENTLSHCQDNISVWVRPSQGSDVRQWESLSVTGRQDVTRYWRETGTVLLSRCGRGVYGRLCPWACVCVLHRVRRESVYRQEHGTSRRQPRPEALIYHRTVIRERGILLCENCWRARACMCTNTPTRIADRGALMSGALRWRGDEKKGKRNSHRKI